MSSTLHKNTIIKGLTEAEKAMLKALGAIEEAGRGT
jgi:hypothetical protein